MFTTLGTACAGDGRVVVGVDRVVRHDLSEKPEHTDRIRSMTTWEYSTVPLLSHATTQILNQWGVDGWELVAVLPGPTGEQYVAFLKRARTS
jgi:hypothetical protein